MVIRKILALKGPNYWSHNRHHLIVMVLDIESLEEYPSNKLPGFYDRLTTLLPSLHSHRCSEETEGGFFKRVKEGTWMGHIIEHVALEIQTLAGMNTGFGRTRGYGEYGVYNVVFSYIEEAVGRYAAKTSVAICQDLIDGKKIDLEAHLQKMREIREESRLGPSTASIIKEAESRDTPWIRLNKYSLCQLGYGANQKRIQAGVTSETSSIAVELACNKEDTKNMLEEAQVPVPKGEITERIENLEEIINTYSFPLTIKPIDGNHGRGVTTKVRSTKDAESAFKVAQQISKRVLIEKYVEGDDYRLLVINNKFIAAAKRIPAHIVGNGRNNIGRLLDMVNNDKMRGYGHEKILTKIEVDNQTKKILKRKNYCLDTILKEEEVLFLKDTANLSTGGTAEDVTDIVHPANVSMAERISKIIDLDICGIDVITNDISTPIKKAGGAVLEVNAGPGFRMHLSPTKGLPRNVAAPVVNKLFPEKNNNGRIPIIAITGTNGKTTTTRLIAHMAKLYGYRVGYTTSDGVYIQNRLLMKGDCSGPISARFVLKDPTVNCGIFECARGGILREGLAFKKCNIGVVTNISEDHLGLNGINTMEDLARVKSVVPNTVLPNGYAVLNADDDIVYKMRKELNCNIALFSLNKDNPRIRSLQKLGGITAIYEDGYITLCKGIWRMPILKVNRIPLTFEGTAEFMIQNILAAVIAANIQGIPIEDMKVALETFIPSPSQTPGRLNFFKFKGFDIILDFAHNPAGYLAIKKMIDKINAKRKIGIIAGVGDRRDQDIIKIGKIAGATFSSIIIRQEKDLRGRSKENIIHLLKKGIKESNKDMKIKIIDSEKRAIKYAIQNTKKGSLIFVSTDAIKESIALIKYLREKNAKPLKPIYTN